MLPAPCFFALSVVPFAVATTGRTDNIFGGERAQIPRAGWRGQKDRSVVSVTVGKRGRPRTYKTVAAFRKAVDGYFEAITRERTLREWVDSGERTNRGKPIMVERDVIGLDGQPVIVFDYVMPPTMPALMLTIGISKSSWDNYRGREGFAEVCADAKLRIEAYLAEQAVLRDKPTGVMFTLENNYGWKTNREIELGDRTREMLAKDMTMAEKMALIRAAAAEAGDEDDGSGD